MLPFRALQPAAYLDTAPGLKFAQRLFCKVLEANDSYALLPALQFDTRHRGTGLCADPLDLRNCAAEGTVVFVSHFSPLMVLNGPIEIAIVWQ